MDRIITLTLTERELHSVCNAADGYAYSLRRTATDPKHHEWADSIKETTEKIRVAWFDQVTSQ
jgi:hypothetical protein